MLGKMSDSEFASLDETELLKVVDQANVDQIMALSDEMLTNRAVVAKISQEAINKIIQTKSKKTADAIKSASNRPITGQAITGRSSNGGTGGGLGGRP